MMAGGLRGVGLRPRPVGDGMVQTRFIETKLLVLFALFVGFPFLWMMDATTPWCQSSGSITCCMLSIGPNKTTEISGVIQELVLVLHDALIQLFPLERCTERGQVILLISD